MPVSADITSRPLSLSLLSCACIVVHSLSTFLVIVGSFCHFRQYCEVKEKDGIPSWEGKREIVRASQEKREKRNPDRRRKRSRRKFKAQREIDKEVKRKTRWVEGEWN